MAYDFRNANYNDNHIHVNELYPIKYTDEILDATFFAGYIMQYTIASIIATQSRFPLKDFNNLIDNFIQCPDLFMQIKVLIHKSVVWQDEREWRMTIAHTPPDIKSACVNKKPCALYLGRKIKDTDELILRNIAYLQKIPVYKMTIDDTSKQYRLKAIKQQNSKKQLLLNNGSVL